MCAHHTPPHRGGMTLFLGFSRSFIPDLRCIVSQNPGFVICRSGAFLVSAGRKNPEPRFVGVSLGGVLQYPLPEYSSTPCRNTPVLPTGYCGTPPEYCGQAVLGCGQPLKTLRNVLRNVRFCLSCARSFIYGTEKCSKPAVAIVRCLQRRNRSGANGLPAFRHFCFRTFICCQEKPIS